MHGNKPLIYVRGGGDLATGVAARLHRCGFHVVVAEVERPRAVRRLVSLAEAIYQGTVEIEDLRGVRVAGALAALQSLQRGVIPVMVDPDADALAPLEPVALIDARMRKKPPEKKFSSVPLVVGLGPGFTAGETCDVVIETKRGHHLGRAIWNGQAAEDTGVPGEVSGHAVDRVLRAPADGRLTPQVVLGAMLKKDDCIATFDELEVRAPFDGVLRGLIHESVEVSQGEKIGDVDPRLDPRHCIEISDKSLAVGGGVLESLLSRPEIRSTLGV